MTIKQDTVKRLEEEKSEEQKASPPPTPEELIGTRVELADPNPVWDGVEGELKEIRNDGTVLVHIKKHSNTPYPLNLRLPARCVYVMLERGEEKKVEKFSLITLLAASEEKKPN